MLKARSLGERRAARGMGRVLARLGLASRLAKSAPDPELEGVAPAALPAPRSLAVLPFVNVTGRPAIDTLSSAVAHRVFERLSGLKGVVVVAYWGPLSDHGEDVYVGRVGGRLRVEALLLGQVRRSAGELRVDAVLLDAASGAQLWADDFVTAQRRGDPGARIAEAVAQRLLAPRGAAV